MKNNFAMALQNGQKCDNANNSIWFNNCSWLGPLTLIQRYTWNKQRQQLWQYVNIDSTWSLKLLF